MRVEEQQSLEERWLDVVRKLGCPRAILACTFTLNADFFENLIARFKEAASESLPPSGKSQSNFPIDVVCDRSNYKGHKAGFNVSFWHDTGRLFHPKLLIAIFDDEVVWSDGSLNLTSAGWRSNREIAMFHRSRSKALPKELLVLLHALTDVASARLIREEANGADGTERDGRFLTSLEKPIGPRFLSKMPRDAEEIHLVAPFFERRESAEAPLDRAWLAQLAERCPRAQFHVYLPKLQSDSILVQGSRDVFEVVADRLRIYPVQPQPGPLHGKAVCVVYRLARTRWARLLTGSPNMTVSALLEKPGRGNLETAWVFDSRWQTVEHAVFEPLRGRNYSLDEVEFEAPLIKRKPVWMPLAWAIYSPFTCELKIAWRPGYSVDNTELRYGKHSLAFDGNVLRNFSLIDESACLVTRSREGGSEDGYCPIFIDPDELSIVDNAQLERTPEAWLEMMGRLEGLPGSGVATKGPRSKKDKQSASHFEWSTRVRELAGRVRYFEQAMRNPETMPLERGYLLKLFQQIFDAHAPDGKLSDIENVWRAWVRLELWLTAKNLAKAVAKSEREAWQKRSGSLVRLITTGLPKELLPQWKAAIRELGSAA